MDIYLALSSWLFMYQVWIIAGLVFVVMEVSDGSAIFFLPLGLASFCVALVIYLSDVEIIPYWMLPNAWYWLIAVWMSFAVGFSFFLAAWRKKDTYSKDINDYEQ